MPPTQLPPRGRAFRFDKTDLTRCSSQIQRRSRRRACGNTPSENRITIVSYSAGIKDTIRESPGLRVGRIAEGKSEVKAKFQNFVVQTFGNDRKRFSSRLYQRLFAVMRDISNLLPKWAFKIKAKVAACDYNTSPAVVKIQRVHR